MRMILGLFAVGAAAYVLSRKASGEASGSRAAYSPREPDSGPTPVRDAGPGAMRDREARDWSSVDEASDQSFPASDPPANY